MSGISSRRKPEDLTTQQASIASGFKRSITGTAEAARFGEEAARIREGRPKETGKFSEFVAKTERYDQKILEDAKKKKTNPFGQLKTRQSTALSTNFG